MSTLPLLRFRCTGCGNCCREPLLPLTDSDLRRLVAATGHAAREVAVFVSDQEIDLEDGDDYVELPEGRRVMVLRHTRGACIYLGEGDRCTVYEHRPLGCRVFPLDADFNTRGQLRQLTLVQATDCRYELDGEQTPSKLRALQREYDAEVAHYYSFLRPFNAEQQARRRRKQPLVSRARFLNALATRGGPAA